MSLPGERQPERFQFGLRSLLIFTTICAVILATARWIGGPLFARVVFVVYLVFVVGYTYVRARAWKRGIANWRRARVELGKSFSEKAQARRNR